MVKPGNISLDKACKITGLSKKVITLLSVSGLLPPLLHYDDGTQINSQHLSLVLRNKRWQTIIRCRYLTENEAENLGLRTDETTFAFNIGGRDYHDTKQALAITAAALMLAE